MESVFFKRLAGETEGELEATEGFKGLEELPLHGKQLLGTADFPGGELKSVFSLLGCWLVLGNEQWLGVKSVRVRSFVGGEVIENAAMPTQEMSNLVYVYTLLAQCK